VTSLLVTNDFPPKIGGIQSYLYELWRRLPAKSTNVFTTAYSGAAAFDAAQDFAVTRRRDRFFVPTPGLAAHVDECARACEADVIFLDPMLPLGRIGHRLRAAPHVIVGHGAEITVYGRVPGSRQIARSVLRGAGGLVAAGEYVARQAARTAGRALPTLVIQPGVDAERFRPLTPDERRAARVRFGFDPDRPLVVGVSRLVPRKGFDVLLDAVGGLDDDVQVAIAGAGRDRRRLDARAAPIGSRAHMLGRVADVDLPALYGCADVFSMLCRDRWGGLEAEGFGIVFVEAAACGVPSVAGRSGGVPEAVLDGVTGAVVDPRDVVAVRDALDGLLRDDARRARVGIAARERAATELSYEALAARLAPLAAGDLSILEAHAP
jgi:phosphatidylinositol alpha-1,6-mannosyltransferase